ncbi:MAG: hypothetical protein MSG64_16600 [Pyrinomonadaceae bacterium MAG19_C2-C3]|nr:hypothetical protein [Pyrinomonadaceae bacterium MAG19_C2-C3]
MKLNYRLAFINHQTRLDDLSRHLTSLIAADTTAARTGAAALVLDIETVNWWNQQHERIALIQLAYRERQEMRVAVIDSLSPLDLTALRPALESTRLTKVIHNAAFDATRLARHLGITTAPIYDTMLAARRNGERRYSLQAQAAQHLNLPLDKSPQTSDWSLRPLSPKQLDYAARDVVATLLLYEHQRERSLRGEYQMRVADASTQETLPLLATLPRAQHAKARTPKRAGASPDESLAAEAPQPTPDSTLSVASLALLGIIAELPSRYSPERLAVSLGDERVGLAGWIVDRMLGRDADMDEADTKMMIADLHQRRLITITPSRRMEASASGSLLWQQHKSK